MKKTTFNIAITAACLLCTVSCIKDLDIQQNGKLSASNMWKDAEDITSSTVGIYSNLRKNFAQTEINVFYWGELRVGEYMWGPSLQDGLLSANGAVVLKNVMTSACTVASWANLYSTIDQANAVLKYAPSVNMKESDRSYAIGQAAFARAYCYFWAVRIWGDVPLTLKPIESISQPETYPVRADKTEVYEQIKNDIKLALDNASNLGNDKYFATENAVNMLKAEYALWMYTNQKGGDSYLSMADEALTAIGISGKGLNSNYASIFDRTNKCSNEVIFALGNDQGEGLTGGYYTNYYFPNNFVAAAYRNNPVPIKSTQYWSYSKEFIDCLIASKTKNNDSRVDCNLGFGDYGITGNTLYWPNKFIGDMSGSSVILDADLMYYRYALAVMMDAELKYYQGNYSGALKSLNLIAQRAYGKSEFYKDTSKEAVLQALCDEYFLEFPCEGIIWWALIRLDKIWDYNPSLKERKQSDNILLWPITRDAINKNNKLTQTPGWN